MFTELSLGCWLSGYRNLSMYQVSSSTVFFFVSYNIMYCSRLFVVAFQEIYTFKHAYVHRVTELHLSTKFHVCQSCG